MKKTLNGVRFDTDKAAEIGRANSGFDRDDLQYWEAVLYVTPRSERYFLVGEGAGMTRYGARDISSGWRACYGERLDPMSKRSAFEWAKKYLSSEEVEEHFGKME